MNVRDLLPIGSVVELKRGTKKLMIFGIAQKLQDKDGNSVDYDYIGVPFPEGNLSEDFQFMFNHEDINMIHFFGFINFEQQEYMEELAQHLESGAAE